jgi:hypothetical protein
MRGRAMGRLAESHGVRLRMPLKQRRAHGLQSQEPKLQSNVFHDLLQASW